ncbi:Thioredoxin domain-containing protein [Bordetella sputigena]
MTSAPERPRAAPRRGRSVLIAIFLITLAPILGAVVMYLNPQWWPDDSSNYGTLVQPQRDIPGAAELPLATLDGQPFDLSSLKGKWLLMTADGGECPESCARKLFIIRNTHASQGKNVDRVARVWFITDDAPVPQKVLEAYRGTVMVRGRPEQLAPFLLGAPAGTGAGQTAGQGSGTGAGPAAAQGAAALAGPIWMVDPLGHLMLQFPAEADPVKVRKDVSKLIYNSRIG